MADETGPRITVDHLHAAALKRAELVERYDDAEDNQGIITAADHGLNMDPEALRIASTAARRIVHDQVDTVAEALVENQGLSKMTAHREAAALIASHLGVEFGVLAARAAYDEEMRDG